jgi:hypothetical protein
MKVTYRNKEGIFDYVIKDEENLIKDIEKIVYKIQIDRGIKPDFLILSWDKYLTLCKEVKNSNQYSVRMGYLEDINIAGCFLKIIPVQQKGVLTIGLSNNDKALRLSDL